MIKNNSYKVPEGTKGALIYHKQVVVSVKENRNMRMVMYFGALMRRISPRQNPRTFGLPKVLRGYQ